MGARREPLVVTITTASEVIDGPFAQELDGIKRVLRGELENDRVFGALFMPDVDDKEDDPNTWAKVQPHMGVTVQADYYEQAWGEAQLSAENRMVFRTKLLNIFAENERRSWISAELARNISPNHSRLKRFRVRRWLRLPLTSRLAVTSRL
jgi:phage terminase large subunit-like protein